MHLDMKFFKPKYIRALNLKYMREQLFVGFAHFCDLKKSQLVSFAWFFDHLINVLPSLTQTMLHWMVICLLGFKTVCWFNKFVPITYHPPPFQLNWATFMWPKHLLLIICRSNIEGFFIIIKSNSVFFFSCFSDYFTTLTICNFNWFHFVNSSFI